MRARAIFARIEHPAERRRGAEHAEVVPRHFLTEQPFRRARAGEIVPDGGQAGERLKQLRAPVVDEVGRRDGDSRRRDVVRDRRAVRGLDVRPAADLSFPH